MSATVEVPGFEVSAVTLLGETRDVYRRGDGPAVVVMSEIPGITPVVAGFARTIADAGFAVFMPQIFGTPMRPLSTLGSLQSLASVCIRREFHVLAANHSSPIVDWMRALARRAHEERGGRGVGAIGMCITGNFALAMMLDAPVLAAVLSQPSLPAGFDRARREALHASPGELAAAHERVARDGARILGLRFQGDPMCRKERFDHLRREFGDAFEAIELPDATANPNGPIPPHSVLTNHLIDEAGQPTRAALERTIAFLREQLRP